MRTFLSLLLLATLLLAGCRSTTPMPVTAPPATATAVPTAAPAATSTPTPAPASTVAPSGLKLEPCHVAGGAVAAECGTLTVPEDRANPSGRVVNLDLVVVRAQGHAPASDPLFFLAGGPGGAATQNTILVTNIFRQVNYDRDVVFLDQRGTAGSHHLFCDPIPFDVANAAQQQVDEWMKTCLAGLKGDPRFYTSAEAMRDLDEARVALGYEKINLYGISYGTTTAQVYMRLFPERVRAAVLDHGTALDVLFAQALPRATQSALDNVMILCEQDEKCRTAYPDLSGEWKIVVDRLSKGPVSTSFTPPGATQPVQVTLDALAEAVHSLLFKSDAYAYLPSLIHTLAINADWTPVVASFADRFGTSGGESHFLLLSHMVFCFEPSWGYAPEAILRLNPGSYYAGLEAHAARAEQKLCAALPKPSESGIYGPGKLARLSVLMLNSRLDPQNPPENMAPALKEFTRSRQIIEPFGGHETSSISCRWDLIAQFIKEGDAGHLDAACIENEPHAAFLINP